MGTKGNLSDFKNEMAWLLVPDGLSISIFQTDKQKMPC